MSDNDLIRREVDNECIKRGDVREHIQRYLSNRNRTTTELMAGLYLIPPADVKPVVRGEWKTDANGWYFCSECGHEMFFTGTYDEEQRFCYYCGADMRKEANDER